MTDILDKVLETAKKLRKYAKKSADPAFVNLITDLNMELADLRVQLAEARGAGSEPGEGQAAPAAATAAAPRQPRANAIAAAPTTQLRGSASIDSTLNTVFGVDEPKQPQ